VLKVKFEVEEKRESEQYGCTSMGLREPWLKEMLKPKPASATVALLLFSYGQSEAIASTRAIKSIDELPYSDNHLASHVLAYTSSCTETVESSGIKDGIFGHVFYMLQGDASARVFGHLNSAGCTVVCLEKGTPRAVIARPMPRRYWIDGAVDLDGDGSEIVKMDLNDFLSSDGCGQVEYGVVNSLDGVSFCFAANIWMPLSNTHRIAPSISF
jgi:hypothetical protein